MGRSHPKASLNHCPFCRRTDALVIHRARGEWLVFEGDELALDEDGEPKVESYDAVECLNCCAEAPYAVWQADGPLFSEAQSRAYLDYLHGPPSPEGDRGRNSAGKSDG